MKRWHVYLIIFVVGFLLRSLVIMISSEDRERAALDVKINTLGMTMAGQKKSLSRLTNKTTNLVRIVCNNSAVSNGMAKDYFGDPIMQADNLTDNPCGGCH